MILHIHELIEWSERSAKEARQKIEAAKRDKDTETAEFWAGCLRRDGEYLEQLRLLIVCGHIKYPAD